MGNAVRDSDAMGACPSCGGPIRKDEKTCGLCGADLTFWAQEHSGLQESEQKEMEAETEREEAVERQLDRRS